MNGVAGIGRALLPLCSSSSSILRLCALLILLSLLHQSAVAYSSVYECGEDIDDVYNGNHLCENVGEDRMGSNDYNQQCPPPAHLVLELKERNDALAKYYAEQNGMILAGPTFISGTSQPFLDTFYFLSSSSVFNSSFIRQLVGRMVCKPGVQSLIFDRPQIRVKRDFITSSQPLVGPPAEERTRRQTSLVEQREVPKLPFRDPLYEEQWYLIRGAEGGEFDMNVREAWMMGYAGRNVTISILDDGIQWDHPDLISNYDPLASFDFIGNDTDPTPRVYDNHGTHCAGVAAAMARNNVCGVGVAFLAKIGGVRMLDGSVSDKVEANSLNLKQQHIDIYSASWGPADDGETFEGPRKLAKEAFYRGIKSGRGGRGNIFVWASGNGGRRHFNNGGAAWRFGVEQDCCSADGYVSSIYTLSISSATYDNKIPWYVEECPSTIATTYSGSNNLNDEPGIVTTDAPHGCIKNFTGTSASAPMAAGIIALALEANPSLTWRDTQHIVLRTANPNPLLNNPGWSINGVGRRISNKFGYGLMDAGALVKLARVWQSVPEQHMCAHENLLERPHSLQGRFALNFSLEVSGCQQGTPVLYLEHVQVITTIRFAKRGDLKLTLYSPLGTRSVLLPPRPRDYNQDELRSWPFLTVQMWGEDPRGVWTLTVESITNNPNIGGMFSDWTLLLYGTEELAQPGDQRYIPGPSISPFRRPNTGDNHEFFCSVVIVLWFSLFLTFFDYLFFA